MFGLIPITGTQMLSLRGHGPNGSESLLSHAQLAQEALHFLSGVGGTNGLRLVTIHIHIVQSSGVHGALYPRHLYASMVWCYVQGPSTLT
jgi:hypothetical protein